MELKDFIIGTLVVGLLTTAFLMINLNMGLEYGRDPSSDYTFIGNVTNNMTSLYGEVEAGSLTNSSISEANPIGFYLFSGQMWAALKLMIKSPAILMTMLSTIFIHLGLGWVLPTIITILGVSVLFMLIWLFWRYRQ